MLQDLIRGLAFEQFSLGGFIFDAYLQMSQTSRLTVTKHPVETGFSISDGSFIEPMSFTFTIGMTDTTLGKIPGQFGDNRSVNAYRILRGMQESRQKQELVGKYGVYQVLVTVVNPVDDYRTVYGMKAQVQLTEIIETSSQVIKLSADPSVTSSINRGLQNVSQSTENVSALVTLGVPAGLI